jgi:hypothetical protein
MHSAQLLLNFFHGGGPSADRMVASPTFLEAARREPLYEAILFDSNSRTPRHWAAAAERG